MKNRSVTRFRTIKPERMQHGTRGCYVAQKCRCEPCRAANRSYALERRKLRSIEEAEVKVNPSSGAVKLFTRTNRKGEKYLVRGRACPGVEGGACVAGGAWLRRGHPACAACIERNTVWNGLVDVGPAREHLRKLSQAGVGYKAVADAASVAYSLTGGIAMGAIRKCRARTLRKILAVDAGARADHSIISSKRLVKNFRWLTEIGFTLRELGKLLGYKSATAANVLLLNARRSGHVVAINDAKIERLRKRVDAGEITFEAKSIRPGYGPLAIDDFAEARTGA